MSLPFRRYIERFVSLPATDWEQIAACITTHDFPANTLIEEAGTICRHLYYLETGMLHYFYWRDGEAKTKFFTFPDQVFTAQVSFAQQIPSRENIACLQDSRVLAIPFEAVAVFSKEIAVWDDFARQVIQQVTAWTEELYLAASHETAEQRYRKLMAVRHPIVQTVPLKITASYLGISPESLSRIRKKIRDEART